MAGSKDCFSGIRIVKRATTSHSTNNLTRKTEKQFTYILNLDKKFFKKNALLLPRGVVFVIIEVAVETFFKTT